MPDLCPACSTQYLLYLSLFQLLQSILTVCLGTLFILMFQDAWIECSRILQNIQIWLPAITCLDLRFARFNMFQTNCRLMFMFPKSANLLNWGLWFTTIVQVRFPEQLWDWTRSNMSESQLSSTHRFQQERADLSYSGHHECLGRSAQLCLETYLDNYLTIVNHNTHLGKYLYLQKIQ